MYLLAVLLAWHWLFIGSEEAGQDQRQNLVSGELAHLFLLGVVADCPVWQLSPEGCGQVMGLLSPVPGEEQQRRT